MTDYNLIATVEVSAEGEAELGSMITKIKNFVTQEAGKMKLLVRTKEE